MNPKKELTLGHLEGKMEATGGGKLRVRGVDRWAAKAVGDSEMLMEFHWRKSTRWSLR